MRLWRVNRRSDLAQKFGVGECSKIIPKNSQNLLPQDDQKLVPQKDQFLMPQNSVDVSVFNASTVSISTALQQTLDEGSFCDPSVALACLIAPKHKIEVMGYFVA